MSVKVSTLNPSMPAGSRVEGATRRTRAPSAASRMMLERATRECRMSPQIATVEALDAALVAADRERVEERLGRMLVRAVARIDDGAVDLLGEEIHGAGRVVAHDDDVRPHGVEGRGGVDERLALLHRRRRDRHVHHVGAEALAGDLEGGLRARRGLEEQVDLRAAAQGRLLLLDLPADLDLLVGEVEQRLDVQRRQALDPEQMPVGIGSAAPWSESPTGLALENQGAATGITAPFRLRHMTFPHRGRRGADLTCDPFPHQLGADSRPAPAGLLRLPQLPKVKARSMKVLVVESPAKAKTINKYLGKGYEVLASFGHIRDLPAKDGSVDPDADFRMIWEVESRGAKRVSDIAKAVKGAEKLILATDPDREGEAISWHVLEALNEKRALKGMPVERVTFNAITKDAVQTRAAPAARDRPGAGRRLSGPPRARLSRRLHPLAGAVAQAPGRPLGGPRAVGGAAPRLRPRVRDRDVPAAGILVARRDARDEGRRASSTRGSSAPTARRSPASTSARARRRRPSSAISSSRPSRSRTSRRSPRSATPRRPS